jgi:hypothetical protein
MIKSFGGTCDLVNGRGEVSLDWYASFREMTLKMQKNFFAITGRFSLRRMVFQALVVVWLALFPLVLLASRVTWVPTWVALASLLLLTNTVIAAAWTGRPILPSFAAPLGLLLTAYMLIRAGVAGHRSGGITWRGVLYPTKLLKGRQRVRV